MEKATLTAAGHGAWRCVMGTAAASVQSECMPLAHIVITIIIITTPPPPLSSPSSQIHLNLTAQAPRRAAEAGRHLYSRLPSRRSNYSPANTGVIIHPLTPVQASLELPLPSDDILAARITQLFYDLDVEMLRTTSSLSGCCCVAAAYAAPLMIVVSCGDCRCSSRLSSPTLVEIHC